MPTVDPEALRQIAPRFSTTLVSRLEAARAKVAETEAIHLGNFTATAVVLAGVHAEVENFSQRSLQTKIEHAQEMTERLNATADTWDEAEHGSTARERG